MIEMLCAGVDPCVLSFKVLHVSAVIDLSNCSLEHLLIQRSDGEFCSSISHAGTLILLDLQCEKMQPRPMPSSCTSVLAALKPL